MKHLRKPALLLAAMVLVASVLASCSSPAPAATTAGPAAQTSTPAPETTPEETGSGIDNSEFVDLKMVMVGPEMDDYKRLIEMVNAKLKDDLNASLAVEFLDWSDWQTKYPLMFASGEEFDMCYASNWAGYVSQALKGAYLSLNLEDVQKYMPRTFANVTEEMWNGCKVNDQIYMIPQTGLQFTGDHNLFLVRGDLMKKYGIAAIKNSDDLIKYWEQVVANDSDLIPIAVNQSWWGMWVTTAVLGNPWLGMDYGNGVYMVYDLSDPNNIKAISDDAYWEYNTKRFKLAKEFLDKGFWSRDAMSQTDEVRDLFINGISATTIGALVDLNNTYEQVNAAHPEWEVQIVDINPNLVAVYYPVTGDGTALHATTKNKERAMQVLDIISYDQDYYDLIYYGVKDQDYTLNADGSYTWINKPVNVGFRGMNNKISRLSTTVAPNFKELLDRFNSVAIYPPMQNFNADNTAVATEQAAVQAIEAKYDSIAHLGFIDGDIDAYVAEFRKELENAGLKKVQDETTRQLQEYMKKYYGNK